MKYMAVFLSCWVCVPTCILYCNVAGCATQPGGQIPDDVPDDPGDGEPTARMDGATRVEIEASGSLQNPAWSPDGGELLLTRSREGYNVEPADVLIVDVAGGPPRTLVGDGSGNVNLPGSSWNPATNQIVFSSSREPHDEIYIIAANGAGGEVRITERADLQAFEPSFSPDAQFIVFESHPLDVEGEGVITVYRVDGTEAFRTITVAGDDCRQPNWSPAGDLIVYQKLEGGQWDLWLTDPESAEHRQLTQGPGDKTDASYSPDGDWIVYSPNEHGEDGANLFVISMEGGDSIRATFFEGYDGAPSWSPDGTEIAFESYAGDPDGSPGTSIWIIAAPEESQSKTFRDRGSGSTH